MKNYRPLLFQEINLRMSGLRLRRLQLNRHLREVDFLAAHQHPFSQILCYLQGGGRMTEGSVSHEVQPGTIALLPPRRRHSFLEMEGRRPLCLVMDLDWHGAGRRGFTLARLSQAETGAIKQELSRLSRLSDPTEPGCRLLVASAALRLLDICLQRLEVLPARTQAIPAFVRHFERLLLEKRGVIPPIQSVAMQMGYQKDYLNRIFKQATGLTLREYRDALLLKKAKQLLKTNERIQAVSEELGFSDQNYFSRWFKKQTGTSPGAFKQ